MKPQTQKERHQVEVKGLTIADISECFYLAIMDSADDDIAREAIKKYKETNKIDPSFVYKLDWEHIDIIAVEQNLNCWIEKKMGIYPNIESLKVDESEEKQTKP